MTDQTPEVEPTARQLAELIAEANQMPFAELVLRHARTQMLLQAVWDSRRLWQDGTDFYRRTASMLNQAQFVANSHLADARDWAAWFAAERDELARQRNFELASIADKQRRDSIEMENVYRLAERAEMIASARGLEQTQLRADRAKALGDLGDTRAKLDAARARIAELEREVTQWQGMYRVASDHRGQNFRDYQEASRWAAWFAAERDWVAAQEWAAIAEAADTRAAELRARIAELESELDNARAVAGANGGSLAALQVRVMELQSQVTARDNRITELEALLSKRDSAIADYASVIARTAINLGMQPEAHWTHVPQTALLAAGRIAALEAGRETEQTMLRNAAARIAELEAAQADPVGYVVGWPCVASICPDLHLHHVASATEPDARRLIEDRTATDARVYELREVQGA